MRNFSVYDTVWRNPEHEMDYIAEEILNSKKHWYVTGKGREILRFLKKYSFLMSQGRIRGIFATDTNEGIDYDGILVVSEEQIIKDANSIVISATYDRKEWDEQLKKWTNKGFTLNQKFFQGEVFAMIYDVYKLNKIHIDRIEIFLTSLCTLNCEKCIAYIPYFKKLTIVSLQQLKEDSDILFQTVDYVYKFKLLGGEVFLYPYLIEYIDYLYEHYNEKIGSIRVGTNGTILPNQAILEMCKRDRVTVDISDYTQAVPNMCKLDEVRTICGEYDVAVDVKRTGEQWLDMGFPNTLSKGKREEQLREHFQKCAMFCRQFSNGKYYFCCSNFAAVKADMFPDDENNYLDFRQRVSKKLLLEFELGYSQLGYTTFCSVCRGCSEEVNPYHVEVAKQIQRGITERSVER